VTDPQGIKLTEDTGDRPSLDVWLSRRVIKFTNVIRVDFLGLRPQLAGLLLDTSIGRVPVSLRGRVLLFVNSQEGRIPFGFPEGRDGDPAQIGGVVPQ